MPRTPFPGMGAMRTLSAWSASARSSSSPWIWRTLVPAAGSNSNIVITGPGWISTTRPSTLKSESARVRRDGLRRLGRPLARRGWWRRRRRRGGRRLGDRRGRGLRRQRLGLGRGVELRLVGGERWTALGAAERAVHLRLELLLLEDG